MHVIAPIGTRFGIFRYILFKQLPSNFPQSFLFMTRSPMKVAYKRIKEISKTIRSYLRPSRRLSISLESILPPELIERFIDELGFEFQIGGWINSSKFFLPTHLSGAASVNYSSIQHRITPNFGCRIILHWFPSSGDSLRFNYLS